METIKSRKRYGKKFEKSIETMESIEIIPEKTICIVVDVWDGHWCQGAMDRLTPILPKINQFLIKMREIGIKIIHAPSDTLRHYVKFPQRQRMKEEPTVKAPRHINHWTHHKKRRWEPLPIDVIDDGCSDNPRCRNYKAWTKQDDKIEISGADLISDRGIEIYSYVKNRNIDTIIYVGVHLNMCVLGRPFGIRKMTGLKMNCIIVRDLIDIMFKPYPGMEISHQEAVEKMVAYVEYQFGRSVLSTNF
jgi:nicotinamidase-related amidase